MTGLGVKLFTAFIVNPVLAIVYLRILGVPLHLTFLFVVLIETISMYFVYTLWGTVSQWMMRHAWSLVLWRVKDYFDKAAWDDQFISALNLDSIYRVVGNNRKSFLLKVTLFVARQPQFIIYLLLLVPFVPYLPTICIIALKNVGGKKKALMLFITNTVRTAFVVWSLYQIPIPDG